MRHLSEYLCEFAGTAMLMLIGVSAVILMWGDGSPIPPIPSLRLRLLATGLLFAGGAALIVYSPLGRRSGGHINPAVTLAFWRLGRVATGDAGAYVAAQFAGALAGVFIVALAWGEMGRSVRLAATLPGDGVPPAAAFAAEVTITFLLVFVILICVSKPRLAPRTALIAGALVAFFVTTESPISGTSVNPARSLAPALVFPVFDHLWIYLIAPPLGALLAAAAFAGRWGSRRSSLCAKLYHTAGYRCIFRDCGYRMVSAGETVIREGEAGDEAYVVDVGELEVRKRAGPGDLVLARLGPGEWVGEMSLLLEEPRSASVVALADAQLRRVNRANFAEVLAGDPQKAMEILRQLARRLRDADRRLAAPAPAPDGPPEPAARVLAPRGELS